MKKIIVFISVAALLICAFTFTANAADIREYGVFDSEDLLSASEEQMLEAGISEIYVNYSYSVIIVTTSSLGGKSAEAYADEFFENCGYGGRDGILFLISIEARDYYFSTGGEGQSAFTDYGIDYLCDKIQPMLSEGDYYGACEKFLLLTDDFISEYKNGITSGNGSGTPYDYGNTRKDTGNYLTYEIILFIIAIIVGIIVISSMKRKMAPPKEQKFASQYIRQDSFIVRNSSDMFLYSTVSKTPKPKPQSSSGSRTHTSSGGFSHGGGGGKF